jgi:predicted PolB exonuclease-like 3'-5' exonuclease
MDVLAMYQPRNNAPLDQVAQLAGLPGKLGIGGPAVWASYLRGEIRKIRDYCEGDCVNTYLLYLRFQRQRGALTSEQYDQECGLLRSTLEATGKPYWREFLSGWKA